MSAFSLPSVGKINRFLHIVGQRQDGYHRLQTLFQFIELKDELHFEVTTDGEIAIHPLLENVDAQDNLIMKAAILLQKKTGCSLGAHIRLDKQLPIGGGLGGGSSNAATTLVALNQLWALNLNLPELLKLGLSLGADVPIFIYGQSAMAEEVGEIFTPCQSTEKPMLVIHPGCHVSTPKLFSLPQLTRSTPELKMEALISGQAENMFQHGLRNDFVPVVRSHYPEVGKALDWLSQYGKAYLSGSGACVFAFFDNIVKARALAKQLPSSWKGFVTKSCNLSPMMIAAKKQGINFKNWGVAKR